MFQPADISNYEKEIDCKICNNQLYILSKTERNAVELCSCRNQRKIQSMIIKSGLIGDFKTKRFDNFITKDLYQKKPYDSALDFLENIDNLNPINNKKSWFVMSGQYGSGKTHICTAISGQAILMGKSFYYLPFMAVLPRLATDLKNFYIDVKNKAEKLLEEIKNVEVLYIDDFLKTRENLALIWEIIDYRYINPKLITIISTEKYYEEIKAIDGSLASRIYERTQKDLYFNEIAKIAGRNFREFGETKL